MTLLEQVKSFLEVAKRNLVRDKYLTQAAILLHGMKKVAIVPLFFSNTEEKIKVREKLRKLVWKVKPDAVFTIQDAWMVRANAKLEDVRKIIPREDARKQEALIVSALTYEGAYASAAAIYERIDGQYVFHDLPDRTDSDYANVEDAWLDGIFPEKES
jgi:hypothetical protein